MRLLLPALACVLALSACSGTVADVVQAAENAVDDATKAVGGGAQNEVGNVVEGALYVDNNTLSDLCHLHVTDFDDPDAEGHDLLEEGQRLAPGEDLLIQPGTHALHDDHNLLVTAESCDGDTYGGYAFSFVGHGGAYHVHDEVYE